MTSLRSHLIRTSGSSLVASILTLLNGIMLARALGPQGRGLYGEILFWSVTVNGLTNLSVFDAAVVRLRDNETSRSIEIGQLINLTAFVTILNAVVMISIFCMKDVFGMHLTAFDVAVSLFYGLVTNVVLMFNAIERYRLEFGSISFERILTPATYALFIGIALVLHLDATGALMLMIAANGPVLILRIARNKALLAWSINLRLMWNTGKTALKFHSSAILALAVAQIDKAAALANFSLATAGHYFVAFSLSGAAYALISQAIRTVMLPHVVGITHVHRVERLQRVARATIVLSFVIAGVIMVCAPFLVEIAFGPKYYDVQVYACWLAFSMLPVPISSLLETATLSARRSRPVFEIYLTTLATVSAFWFVGELTTVPLLCTALFLGRTCGVVLASRYVRRAPLQLNLAKCVIPLPSDFREAAAAIQAFRNGRAGISAG